ncbi:MAG: SUMF1/EgtB/PvdO family nonheme iron enzyme [Nitrospiraceae bacterium]
MSKILISYRREDSSDVVGRIYDRLVLQFGEEAVFKDVDSIPLGVDFRTYLDTQVAKCTVFLAVIGKDWMRSKSRSRKVMAEHPPDYVQIEVEAALRRQIPVIPVLVRGASIPDPQRLPSSIRDLSYRNSIHIRPDPDFHRDMSRLIDELVRQESVLEMQEDKSAHSAHMSKALQLLKPTVGSKVVPQAGGWGGSSGSALVAPDGMVLVPKGDYLAGEARISTVVGHDFFIDRYPVTNDKFQGFVLGAGYEVSEYWSEMGWAWRTMNNVTAPKYWNDPAWNKGNWPVVGVSYFEAEAYAKWSGKRLPTEQEWEKAARGVDGRTYPWGNDFSESKCNCQESGISCTTPVSNYLAGTSPYGCHDMAGNVWEWCVGMVRMDTSFGIVRGGSWINTSSYTRSTARYSERVDYRENTLGFRLVQDIE